MCVRKRARQRERGGKLLASQINIDCTYTLEFNGKNIDGKSKEKYNLYRSKFHTYRMISLASLCCVVSLRYYIFVVSIIIIIVYGRRAYTATATKALHKQSEKARDMFALCRCVPLLLTLAAPHLPFAAPHALAAVYVFYEFSIGSVRIMLSHSLPHTHTPLNRSLPKMCALPFILN